MKIFKKQLEDALNERRNKVPLTAIREFFEHDIDALISIIREHSDIDTIDSLINKLNSYCRSEEMQSNNRRYIFSWTIKIENNEIYQTLRFIYMQHLADARQRESALIECRLNVRISVQNSTIKRLQSEIISLKIENDKLKAALNDRQSENTETEEPIEKTKRFAGNTESKDEIIMKLKGENELLRLENQGLRQKLKEVQVDVDSLKTQLDMAQKQANKVPQLSAQITILEQQVKQFTSDPEETMKESQGVSLFWDNTSNPTISSANISPNGQQKTLQL